MGLSGVRNKSKLSHDPNNTNWSKSTTNFGHKILTAQGWKPGDYLGAENAAHSSHYTAANASHIRVVLREENMGIGVQVGKGNAETFGLSMFSGLLGRLNGKSDEELEKKQNALRDVELGTFHARKYGSMNFVSGGLLVGDRMEFPESTVLPGKKRKAEDEPTVQEPETKKTKQDNEPQPDPDANVNDEDKRKRKAEKRERKEQESKAKEERRMLKAARKAEKSSKPSTDDNDKARLKAEKRARREERRARKEQKRARRAAKAQGLSAPSTETTASSSESDGTATPPVASAVFGGRHAVRQRYIMQKRRAHMDPQALKEIFMLQAKAAAS